MAVVFRSGGQLAIDDSSNNAWTVLPCAPVFDAVFNIFKVMYRLLAPSAN